MYKAASEIGTTEHCILLERGEDWRFLGGQHSVVAEGLLLCFFFFFLEKMSHGLWKVGAFELLP